MNEDDAPRFEVIAMGFGMVYMGDSERRAISIYDDHVRQSKFDSQSKGYCRTVWMADNDVIVRQHKGLDWEQN